MREKCKTLLPRERKRRRRNIYLIYEKVKRELPGWT